MTALISILATAVFFFGAQTANAQQDTAFDETLFNRCEPMGLSVEDPGEDATKFGLTKESIIDAVESRLRAARMFKKKTSEFLYVQVSVSGSAVALRIELYRWLRDLGYGRGGTVAVWETVESETTVATINTFSVQCPSS